MIRIQHSKNQKLHTNYIDGSMIFKTFISLPKDMRMITQNMNGNEFAVINTSAYRTVPCKRTLANRRHKNIALFMYRNSLPGTLYHRTYLL